MSIDDRPPSSADEPQRDAWLAEALRHAPDASATPPSTLTDAILRQARATAREPLPAGTSVVARRPWAAAWAWLARPPVAAGFASVMVATVVGLMWWDRPLEESFDSRRAEGTRAPASKATTASAPSADRIDASPQPAREAAAAVAAAPPRQKPVPAATPAPPAPAPSHLESQLPSVAAAPARNATHDATTSFSAAKRSRSLAEPRIAPLDEAIASIARDPRPWSWQRSAGHLPMTESLANWLGELHAASTASSWRSSTDAPPATRPLRLYRDGALVGTVIVDAEGVWFTSPSQMTTRLTLTPAAATSLQRALDLAAP